MGIEFSGSFWSSVILLILSIVVSIIMQIIMPRGYYRYINAPLLVLIGLFMGIIIVSGYNICIVIALFIVESFRFFSLLRIESKNQVELSLKSRIIRSEAWINSISIILILIQIFASNILTTNNILSLFSIISLLTACIFMMRLRHASIDYFPSNIHESKNIELPSITVAVPARNETNDLALCLESILANTYQKMEVLVLDDCSQDDTSEIIKGFAHRGVRFLKGRSPDKKWLAKNWAYQQLIEEADSDYILFCGVDTRFANDSIKKIVTNFVQSQSKMTSILPIFASKESNSKILQPMRYYRELVFPKFLSNYPTTLSTCWMIKKSYLLSIGGFDAYKKTIKPEKHFARKASTHYNFLTNNKFYNVTSVKSFSQQISTDIRTRYPEHHKRPEEIMIYSVWFIIALVLPLPFGVYTYYQQNFSISSIFFGSTLVFIFIQLKVTKIVSTKLDLLDLIRVPICYLSEVVVLNYSMWAYEFSSVIWKGRNICMPKYDNTSTPKIPGNSIMD